MCESKPKKLNDHRDFYACFFLKIFRKVHLFEMYTMYASFNAN